jgi:hypothetical protein
MAMNRADFRKQLQEGLNAVFGQEYARYPEEWRECFEIGRSDKAFEEDVLLVGFGGAPVKPEGEGVGYDEGAESYVSRYTHETIALAFAITEEAEEDGLYGSLGAKYSRALARSLQHTKEVKGANVLNNAFDATNYPGGDAVSLCNASHPQWGGGLQSNTLATPADLSEASLEQAALDVSAFDDDRGIPIACQIKKLIIPTELQFVATRLLMTPYRTNTADNDVSAIYTLGTVGEGFAVNHRLTDPDAWFLITDCPDGLKHFIRKPVSRGLEGDFETGNLRYKARERYSFGWSDWRGAYGSPGA